jgi:hypothetical protein
MTVGEAPAGAQADSRPPAANPRVTEATHWLARVNHRVRFYVLGGRAARENAAQHTLERPRGRLGFSPRPARSRIPPKKAPR